MTHCAHLGLLVLLCLSERRTGKGRILLASCLPADNKASQHKVGSLYPVPVTKLVITRWAQNDKLVSTKWDSARDVEEMMNL